MLADRRGERQGQSASPAADLEHALAAGQTQPRQQQREAFLVSSLPEAGGGYPARPGNRIPIAALGRVRVESCLGHLARSPVFASKFADGSAAAHDAASALPSGCWHLAIPTALCASGINKSAGSDRC